MSNISLFPYQVIGKEFLMSRGSCLLCDEQGLGKTIQVLSAIKELNDKDRLHKVLVVCPAIMRTTWSNEASLFFPANCIEVLKNSKSEPSGAFLTVCSYEYITSNWLKGKLFKDFDCVVLDESHKIKNVRSQRTKACLKLLSLPNIKWRWLLSGTPITKNVDDLYPQLRPAFTTMKYEEWMKNVYTFREHFMYKREGYFGIEWYGTRNKDELLEVLARCMIRRKKSDVLTDLPKLLHNKLIVDINKKVADESLQFVDLALKKVLGESLEGRLDKDMSQHIATVKKNIGLQKVKPTVEYVLEFLEENPSEKLVVFAYHNDVIESIVKALQYKNVRASAITGETSAKIRDVAITNFQKTEEDSLQVLVCNILAAGVGVTLTAAHTEVFAELDWTPANMSQAEARCHRIGQKNDVNVMFILANDSVDTHIFKTLLDKMEVIESVIK